MRYLMIIFLSLVVIISCDKREEVIPSNPDYIIGQWKLEKITVFGIEQDITDCHKTSRMTFSSNHDAHARYYTIYQTTGNCVLHLEYSGTWEYQDGEFIFKVDSQSNNSTINKVLNFLDTEHFYVEETFNGVTGKFYFEKID